jgi:aryl-alcohol dehydrogenase-like predicted oxidoreductase
MVQAVTASLKRQRTDSIDSHSISAWDPITPVEEVLRGRNDLLRPGKVLDVGIADGLAGGSRRRTPLEPAGAGRPSSALPIEYSLIERTVERPLIRWPKPEMLA